MTYHHGWLYLVDPTSDSVVELVNHARTAAYLESSTAMGCGLVSNVIDDGGCWAYAHTPACSNGSTVWSSEHYDTPTLDATPWYSSSYPESAKALGFWITEWTGLDSGHIVRGQSPLGSLRGGAQPGRLGARGRTMALNVILFGESEKALDYLFRWLDAALTNVCSTWSTNRALIRRFCPESDDSVDEGVVELRDVGLVEGLKWEKPVSERLGCFMRPASFTLLAGDPCMYFPEVSGGAANPAPVSMNTCFGGITVLDTGRSECRPTCSELEASSTCRAVFTVDIDAVGAVAPYLLLENEQDYPTVPVRVAVYADPAEIGLGGICGLPLLAELYVNSLPTDSELIYDAAGRRVLYRDASTGSHVNGWAYTDVNSVGVPRFPALGCGRHLITIEPASLCFSGSSGAWVDADAVAYSNGYLPTPTLYLQERAGCP